MTDPSQGARPFRVATPRPVEPHPARQPRRGVAILPSLFTLGNLFCGYACIIYAMRGEFETAAPFIGLAVILDILDGRIARLTGTASEFGVQFDSMADVVSFGLAPAVLTFAWGLSTLGRLGWATAFLFVTTAALRLARFNIQTPSADKRFFVGLPSPAAAGVLASTVFAYPAGLLQFRSSLPAILLVVVPALMMVSTVKFRSFKTFDLQARRPFRVLILFAVLLLAIVTHPQSVLVVMSYGYLISPLIGMLISRLRRKPDPPAASS